MQNNERELAVARDVLNNLAAIKLKNRNYFEWFEDQKCRLEDLEGELQKHVQVVQENCHVCLLGACVLSKARVYDALDMDTFRIMEGIRADEESREALEDVFDRDTLNMFEAAFEQWTYSWQNDTDVDKLEAAKEFGKRFRDPKERVKAVMENYIANNGRFIP